MKKTVLITGSTDGIGLATAKSLLELGHTILLHGRSDIKLAAAQKQLSEVNPQAEIEMYNADLASMDAVKSLALRLKEKHKQLDVLINNAGVYKVPEKVSPDGFDMRFAVNTIAPYLLTQQLIPLLGPNGRVINLSSAAQMSLVANDLTQVSQLSDDAIYAQSKLALTMWSRQMALTLGDNGPAIIAVNPASLLGSKMVKQAYGVNGADLQIGADILLRAALSDEFRNVSGLYFDNDRGSFTNPHRDALNEDKIADITQTIEAILARYE